MFKQLILCISVNPIINMKNNKNKKEKAIESSVRVLIRVRPLISIEQSTKNIISISSDEKSVSVKVDQYNVLETNFDHAFSQQTSQEQIFNNIKPYVKQIYNSYNMTIFAYGQTGSGKTYTMFGRDWENNFQLMSQLRKSKSHQNTPLEEIYEDSGIIPRTSFEVFNWYQDYKYDYNIFCSFLQIYNQKIYDLLNDLPQPHPLAIHQSKFQGIFVEGLGQFQINNYLDCLELLKRGEKNRKVRQTSMNAKSSRSHTIFKLMFESKKLSSNGSFSKVVLNLCDLAGSEKINKKESMVNEHLQQLKNINLSLTTLGKVINSLSKGQQKSASFRESKLTRLLQQSLTGNTNTFIVGTLSPSSKNIDETISTLKFAQRAKHVKLKFKPNIYSTQNGEVILKLQQQLQKLKSILQQKQRQQLSAPPQLQKNLKMLQIENKKLKETTQKKEAEFIRLMKENREIKNQLHYMEKIAQHEVNGADDRTISIYSKSNSEYEAADDHRFLRRGKQKQKQVVLPFLKKQNERKKISKREVINKNIYLSEMSEDQHSAREAQQKHNQVVTKGSERQKNNKNSARSEEDAAHQKRSIINRYEEIENLNKSSQNSILFRNKAVKNQRRNSHNVSKISKNSQTIQLPDISAQTLQSGKSTRRTIDYRQKIRELERRLRR